LQTLVLLRGAPAPLTIFCKTARLFLTNRDKLPADLLKEGQDCRAFIGGHLLGSEGLTDQMPRLLALVLALVLAGARAQAEERFIMLVNGTQYSIQQLNLSAHELNFWTQNLLPPPTIKPGESRRIAIPDPSFTCNGDLRVAFAEIGDQPIWSYLNLCNLQKIRLRYDQYSQVPTASYEE
jgi:hypothetical protein